MVGNSATRSACEFQRTERRRHDEHETPTGRKKHGGPVAPRLTGPLRDRLKGQAAKEEVSTMAKGLDAGKYFWRSGREKCFSLDIPFSRTSGPCRRKSVLGITSG
jgi:hypothetical protein